MNSIVAILIAILISLLAGSSAMWYYLIKVRKNKIEETARAVLKDSEEEDSDRDAIRLAIQDRIDKNEEIRKKLQKKLEQLEG